MRNNLITLHEWLCEVGGFDFLFGIAGWSGGNAFVSEVEVWGSNLGLVKLATVLPTARHHCDISSKAAVLPSAHRPNNAKMAPLLLYTLRRNAASIMRDWIKF